MKKHGTEFKLKVVRGFLAGEGGAKLLARQWSLPEPKRLSVVKRTVIYTRTWRCPSGDPNMINRTSALRLITVLGAAALLAACSMLMHRGGHHGAGPMAMAKLEATRGNATNGMVMFHAMGDHLMMHARVEGLKPGQEHGFHIHEKGDCSSGDGMSTGGHFNPTGKPHGAPSSAERHAGDLPSLTADAQGRVDVKVHLVGLTIGSGATDIIGKGLIVHAMPDDYTTQPTGNSGARIACAVIARH